MINPADLARQIEDSQKARMEVANRIKPNAAMILSASSLDGWQSKDLTRKLVSEAKAAIERELETLTDANERETARGLGMFFARVEAAKYLAEQVKAEGADLKVLERLYVRIIEDAVEGGNLIELPTKSQTGEDVTVETLKKEGRHNEMVVGRGRLRVKADGRLQGKRYWAPKFQKSKAIQALALSLRNSFRVMFEAGEKEFKERKAQAVTGEVEMRVGPELAAKVEAALTEAETPVADADAQRIAAAQAAEQTKSEPTRRNRTPRRNR